MGARKRLAAEKRKAANKTQYFAKLNGCPSSPRKMRYVVDMIRGMEVNRALGVLRFSKKAASENVEKLLRSAIANWEAKNDRKAECLRRRGCDYETYETGTSGPWLSYPQAFEPRYSVC